MSKDIFCFTIVQQMLLRYHLDSLVILALLRARVTFGSHLSWSSHMNKEIYIVTGAVVLYPLL